MTKSGITDLKEALGNPTRPTFATLPEPMRIMLEKKAKRKRQAKKELAKLKRVAERREQRAVIHRTLQSAAENHNRAMIICADAGRDRHIVQRVLERDSVERARTVLADVENDAADGNADGPAEGKRGLAG